MKVLEDLEINNFLTSLEKKISEYKNTTSNNI